MCVFIILIISYYVFDNTRFILPYMINYYVFDRVNLLALYIFVSIFHIVFKFD